MNEKKKIKRKLIRMQNAYGKKIGKMAWKNWKEAKKEEKNG